MTVSLLLLFSFLFIAGCLLQLSSLSKYSSFVSTEGEIIAFIERIGAQKKSVTPRWFTEPMPVAYLPVVAYRVGEAIYEVEISGSPWSQPDFSKRLSLVYNPYQPEESYVKEGTPFLGLLLMGVSSVAIIFLLVL